MQSRLCTKDPTMARKCPPTKLDRALTTFKRNSAEGLEELEALAEKYGKDPSVRHAFGSALMSVGAHWIALEHLDWAERSEPTLEHRKALTAAYRFLSMPLHAARVAARDPALSFEADEDGLHGLAGDMPRSDKLLFERGRTAALHGEEDGLEELVALTASYPTSMPILNAIATARYAVGDLRGFRTASREALAADPKDIHALLNAIRVALLDSGPESVLAFRDRVYEATMSAAGMVHPELARAEALAYMNDSDGTAASLAAWRTAVTDPDEAEGSAIASRLEESLRQRSGDPGAPLWRLEVLLFGWIRRWSEGSGDLRMTEVARELAAAPGVFASIPSTLGWERPWLASMLVHVVLSWDAPDPPAPAESWPGLLRGLVERGAGTATTIQHLRSVLDERGLMEDQEPVAFGIESGGGEQVTLELFHDAIPSGLPPEDDERYTAAMGALMRSDLDTAASVLADLHARHPDAVGVEFNLALTDRLRGGSGTDAAHDRLERIAREHPEYLFAKAQLAVDAIEAGDLDRARAYVQLPDGIDRFHAIAFANLHAAEGRLALAEGRMADVERILASLHDLVGEYAPPYQRLKAAVAASGRDRAVPAAGSTAGGGS
jgi:hypothetical protein